jgi:hypothetical protein
MILDMGIETTNDKKTYFVDDQRSWWSKDRSEWVSNFEMVYPCAFIEAVPYSKSEHHMFVLSPNFGVCVTYIYSFEYVVVEK